MLRDLSSGHSADNEASLIDEALPVDESLEESFPIRVRDHLKRLRSLVPVISVSVLALRGQNVELDEDIASVLQEHVIEPLDNEIEELEALLEALAAHRSRPRRA